MRCQFNPLHLRCQFEVRCHLQQDKEEIVDDAEDEGEDGIKDEPLSGAEQDEAPTEDVDGEPLSPSGSQLVAESQDVEMAEAESEDNGGLSQKTLIMGQVDTDEEVPPLEAPPDSQVEEAGSPETSGEAPCPVLGSDDEGESEAGSEQDCEMAAEELAEETEEITTPQKPWPSYHDKFFTTPQYGNSGPHRGEVVEMCLALMQFLTDNHPDIMKSLGPSIDAPLTFIDLVCGLPRKDHLVNYMDHCEWAFQRWGIKASSWLSTRDHWNAWEYRYFKDGGRKAPLVIPRHSVFVTFSKLTIVLSIRCHGFFQVRSFNIFREC